MILCKFHLCRFPTFSANEDMLGCERHFNTISIYHTYPDYLDTLTPKIGP